MLDGSKFDGQPTRQTKMAALGEQSAKPRGAIKCSEELACVQANAISLTQSVADTRSPYSQFQPLFTYFLSQLTSINAQYWIDYGTLLGGIREGQLLAHEFDLDMAAQEEACPAIIAGLKEKMKAEGYPSYEQGEWIEQKYK